MKKRSLALGCWLLAGAVCWFEQTAAGTTFPLQGDDTTSSMGVFRVVVAPAFRPLLAPNVGFNGYPGYVSADGRLTSPALIDTATTIGRSDPHDTPLVGSVNVGSPTMGLLGYGDYPAIPSDWSGAPAGTREILTQIRSFALATLRKDCPSNTDPRVPSVPLDWVMVKAGPGQGVALKSIGMVQEITPNGAADPDFPARSFFDIFVQVSLPPVPGTVSMGVFPGGGATLYNDSPLIITNQDVMALPPNVVYIHGETTAVPLKFLASNPPYWNAGDVFGYVVLAGHGTQAGCGSESALLDAVLGPLGASKPELPIEWQFPTNLCPTPTTTYNSARDVDVLHFPLPSGPINNVFVRNIVHTNLSGPIVPPPLNSSAVYTNPATVVNVELSTDGASWFPATANGPVGVQINHTSDQDGTSYFDTEMLALNLQGTSLFGPFMLRESPTLQSTGKHTIRPSGQDFFVSSFFDVFLEVSLDGGGTWFPADRAIRVVTTPAVTNSAIPIAAICSSNITVTATGPGGAVVFYTSTASGGCSPPATVVCDPPSGSTFPIGTTPVTCMAYDTCGNTNLCSFDVTVNPPPTVQSPEYFNPQPLLPPPNSVYISPGEWHVLYAQGIVVRDVRHRFFTQNYPLPPLGTSQTETFSSEVDFDLSTDNGQTFQPASGTAAVTVHVTHTQDVGGTMFFDTEMLQLDLTSGGLMLRESPTLQSTGQTTVRPVAGGYMISSFFDIFTEVSVDGGGASWQPAQQAGHVEMHPDPKQVSPVSEPTQLLPPPNGAYVSPAQWHALYAQGIVIQDVSHKLFTGALLPPVPGATNTHDFNSQIDLQVSTDGGNTYQSVRVPASVEVSVANHGSSANTIYDTEMTLLDLTLPDGAMIRESPTEPSRGQTEIDAQPDGTFRVTSFFDIFTELSLDGGASWSPATNGPVRMELTTPAPEVPKPTSDLPPADGSYVSPAQWHALYANGIIITNASHDRFTQTQPLPPPGGSQGESFGSTVTGLVSMNGGASFTPFQAPANVSVQVDSRSDLDTGNTRFFDTEMLSLNLSGGTLPGGIMVRESPSKASLGRTSVRTAGTGYQVSSFFDIFTEVSMDGGQTWSPSVTAPGTMSLKPNVAIAINCPADIIVTAPPGQSSAAVFYTVTASGGCSPPPTVSINPPSGTVFTVSGSPHTVTATAYDSCGDTNTCSFTVTVNPPTPQTPPEFFSKTDTLPPTNTTYVTPEEFHAAYANGVVISNVAHRGFTSSGPLPAPGATNTHSFGSVVDVTVSSPALGTVQVTAPANVTVQVTPGQGASGTFDTEMLQLDISGGGLPQGMMLRESPTLQSTGQTTVRPVAGGFMISSFFDVFTELSLDGGQTWSPATGGPAHVEMRNDPRQVTPVTEPTPLLPPPNGGYVSPEQWHALFAQGIVIKDLSHKFFTDSLPQPPPGGSDTHTFNSQVDMQVSTDGGQTFHPERVSAPVQVQVSSVGSGDTGMVDTEMTALNLTLSGGVMVRESPTEPSRGETQTDAQPDGTYRISSFFDIFTEVSLDGGQTWSPATNGPVRMQLTSLAPEQATTTSALPPTPAPYVSPAEWHALYANGIILTNVSHWRFTQTQPLPPPGTGLPEYFDSTVSGQISADGGATFTPFSAPGAVAVEVDSRSDLDTSSTRFFDTEMLALNISGGNLPAGVMVRESPSKASLGRTSVRTAADGTYRISSFFDVFTELSLDGGQTWSPSTTPPAEMSPGQPARKRIFPGPQPVLPPTNGEYVSPQQWHAMFTNGSLNSIVISNVIHRRFLGEPLPLPQPGTTNLHTFNSEVDFLLSMDGGQTFQPVSVPASVVVSVGNSGTQGSEQVYQTEMLSLDLTGGSLPAGVRLRESPTRASTGETRVTQTPGGFRISSFFDVFTELSLDGGQTWLPSDRPGHVELHIDPAATPTMLLQTRFQGGHPSFTLPTQPGLRYTLQFKNNLTDPGWSALSVTPGDGQAHTLGDSSNEGETHRYYRVFVDEDPNQ